MSRIVINDLNPVDSELIDVSETDLNFVNGQGWRGALIGGIVGFVLGGPAGAAIGATAGSIVEDVT